MWSPRPATPPSSPSTPPSPRSCAPSAPIRPPCWSMRPTPSGGTRKQADANEDLRGLLNAGHQRNRPMLRWDVTSRTAEQLDTFAMALLAAIGELPDTIMDRAVVVRMRRRAPGEQVDPYRTRRDAPPLHDLRDRLTAWTRAHVRDLHHATPAMPLEDRAADTWEPLVAIADLAGGNWPGRARDAATAMTAAEAQQEE